MAAALDGEHQPESQEIMNSWDDIAFVKRRLRNARRRAVYWSGNPSFNPHARAVDKHREHEFRYEMALNDVHSIGCILARLEKRAEPERREYDPKRDFGRKFVQFMEVARKYG